MIRWERRHKATPSLSLHLSKDSGRNNLLWKNHSISEVTAETEIEPTESGSSSFSESERQTPQTPRNEEKSEEFDSLCSNSGNNLNRLREYRQRERMSNQEAPRVSRGTAEALEVARSSSGKTLQRIREFREQRKSMGEGLDGSSNHSRGPAITWQRQQTKRLTSLSEANELEDNPLLSPISGRIRITREYSSGTTSTRTLSGSSTRTLSGSSMRRIISDNNDGSTRSLMRNSQAQSMRSLTSRNGDTVSRSSRPLSRNHSGGTAARIREERSLSRSEHRGGRSPSRLLSRNSSGGTAARIREERILSRSEHGGGRSPSRLLSRNHSGGSGGTAARIRKQRSLSQSEHGGVWRRMPAGSRDELRSSNCGASAKSATSGSSSIDDLPSNSSVKGTTLELLALIKKRRQARARQGSMSPVPTRRSQPSRRRSTSFSPNAARQRLEQLEEKVSRVPFSPASTGRRKRLGKKKLDPSRSMSVNSNHSISKNSATELLPTSIDTESLPRSDQSMTSFTTDGEFSAHSFHEEDMPIESAHEEKMRRMRAEMEELQQQLSKTQDAKAQEMQDLKDDKESRKAEMMQNAKNKIQSNLESEMELQIYTMEVEQSRLETMKEALEKGKNELIEDKAEVQSDLHGLMQQNKQLDADNKEIHRMYTDLTKWVQKKTEQNKKLETAEAKLKQIYSGSLALMVEEKLSSIYRQGIYKVAQGVNDCEGFDFELNEEVWDMIKEVEAACDKDVIDMNDIEEWAEVLDEKESPLVGLLIDPDDNDVIDDLTTSIRTRSTSTLGSLDLSVRSRTYDASYRTQDTSYRTQDTSYRTDGTSIDEEEDDADEDFAEDLERLNDSVRFYENVLAEVSVNLDAAQMNTLHENKEMLVSIFNFMDVDGSGDIDLEEFKVGIELLNKRLPESSHFEDAEVLFKLLDVDNSGTIDVEEFERVFQDD